MLRKEPLCMVLHLAISPLLLESHTIILQLLFLAFQLRYFLKKETPAASSNNAIASDESEFFSPPGVLGFIRSASEINHLTPVPRKKKGVKRQI
jgi:hypothetical protein